MAMTKERAYEIVQELLKMEEDYDINFLTTAERSELQQIIKDAMTGTVLTEEQAKQITVGTDGTIRMNLPTPEGELRTYLGTNPDYPSITTMLNLSGTDSEIDIACVEYSVENGLRAIIWGDAMTEDYTHSKDIENLSECRKQLIDEITNH